MASDTNGNVQTVLEEATIRFAGDSGDGMQITGNEFTRNSALFGNDLATFPDFPAEIRAPVGTLPGVSAFQVRFSSKDIHTPGDAPDVLVAMNPAALKVNLADVKPNGVVIANTDAFQKGDLIKAKYESNPLDDGTLDGYRLIKVDVTNLTRETLKESGLDPKTVARCKNFFALGIVYWMYQRPIDPTVSWLDVKFGKKKPEIADANKQCLKAGWNYADITGIFQTERYEVPKATLPPGTYRNMSGNVAAGLGLVAASQLSGLKLFYASYPITPASDILHQLAAYKNYGVVTFQAEDEIAAMCAAVGASYGGALSITGTSGPGLALKSEALNLAVVTELPMVVVNVQRGGPSTGLPTKTEQSDLLQSMYGRNGDSPIPIVAAATPADCFGAAVEACRIAVEHMTPVLLLTDGYLANGAEPWRLPKIEDLPKIKSSFVTDPDNFEPFRRDERGVRPWAIPGTPGLQHRVGGLEKADITGDISYDHENHEKMTWARADKVAKIADGIAPFAVDAGPSEGKVLVLGWGSTKGAITGAVDRLIDRGLPVARSHFRHLNPFPHGVADLMDRFEHVLVPEMNTGQLSLLLQGRLGRHVTSFPKIQGKPFSTSEILDKVEQLLGQVQ